MKLLSIFKFFSNKDSVKFKTFYQNCDLLTKSQKELLESCKKVLTDNKVPLNKIRFVLEPSFTYDIDKNIINPPYKRLVSNCNKYPVIEVNKPKNIMTIIVGEYRTYNNFLVLKEMIKNSKRGLVVLANEIDYQDMIGIVNLDDAIEFYNKQNNYIDYIDYID